MQNIAWHLAFYMKQSHVESYQNASGTILGHISWYLSLEIGYGILRSIEFMSKDIIIIINDYEKNRLFPKEEDKLGYMQEKYDKDMIVVRNLMRSFDWS